ncbi:hypothetical protein [Carboxydothermus pertinax]|uniref:Glutamine synthetase n=1 Tax=Carboxydothermus pertinax TaxID=870242 RepID=A0A1L8CSP5_9THEO|nr:hypothetical protein [Carboxydothermus pertinax]GAV21946.1 glutamine synthetase [Carboxydothermus pertinax]
MEHMEFLEQLNTFSIKFLRLQFVDVAGNLKNVAVTSENVGEVLKKEMTFIHNGEKVLFEPDLESLTVLPWRPREGAVGRIYGNLLLPKDEQKIICPRKFFTRFNFSLEVAVEFSFYLQEKAQEKIPIDPAGLWDVSPLDLGENLRRDVVLTLEKMGIGIKYSGHGANPGEQVLGLKPVKGNKLPDILTTAKFVVRTIAERHGLNASFFPYHHKKPGLSIKYTFFGEKEEMEMFYQKIVALLPDAEIIFRPLINDYYGYPQKPENFIFYDGDNIVLTVSPKANPYLALSLLAMETNESAENQTFAADFGQALRRFSESMKLQEFFGELFWRYLKIKQRSYHDFWAKVHEEGDNGD